ncbi:hypothetical protein, variant [Verruconis gallopava]|uniref:GED domain-containing protein n=1 Tax=Verruconis gallopava TaxID=253628 RepID=A0A0D2AJE4_9PEZI|nr:hypothetical protein, variant [Verruconis gallopava]KIW06705.1 hypothetical protein, variant [Verruconis gallopava]
MFKPADVFTSKTSTVPNHDYHTAEMPHQNRLDQMPGSFQTTQDPTFYAYRAPQENVGTSARSATPGYFNSNVGGPSYLEQTPPTPPSSARKKSLSDRKPVHVSQNPEVTFNRPSFEVPDTPSPSPSAATRSSNHEALFGNPSTPKIPPARTLRPSVRRGDEGLAWEKIISDLSLHDEKENQFLDLVDEMRKHGLERELSLPRLVVCGKQSSGKSSVLEAITRLPFPRGDTTCTRFVTEIRMIRDAELSSTTVSVTIRPGLNRNEIDAQVLKKFDETCTPDGFEALFTRAASAMGILEDEMDEMFQFSQDTLCVEIKGPHCQRISLVDLPGLISANKGKKDDIKMVESITDSYIKDERTIILAVVNAEGNVNDHSILEKARLVDPNGERTFGIITKPDRLEAGLENETDWLNLAFQNDNAFFKFGKGCHVMVNRNGHDTKERTPSDARDLNEEEFFQSEKWGPNSGRNAGKINRWHELFRTRNWGVKNLRPRLTQLLFLHTRKQISTIRRDINKRIAEYNAEINRLSLGILDQKELRKVLSKKSGNMLTTTVQGVDGTNRDAEFFGVDQFESNNGPARYLRGRIRTESEFFNQTMNLKGHRKGYAWGPDEPTPKEFPEVDKFHHFLKESLGTELPGNFDPQRTTLLFIHYSKPWQNIAQDYLDRAYNHAREFVKIVVSEKLGKDLPEIAIKLRQYVLEDRLEELKKQADAQLREIEQDRQGNVITEDMRFLMESSKRFTIRLSRRVEKTSKDSNSPTPEVVNVISLEEPESKRQEAALQMIEEMLIYYRIARARYIDNVIIQVVERCLLSKLRNLFEQDWMEDENVYRRVTHDPGSDDRRRKKEAAEERRKSLRDCLIRLESLDT